MAKAEDVLEIKKILSKGTNDANSIMGSLAVIKYLTLNTNEVTSKQISDELHVSSARMTILLKKLQKDNIIEKEKSKSDARSINIKLTEHGKKKSKELEDSFHLCVEKLLDVFEFQELIDLLKKMNILKDLFKENFKINLKENFK